MSEQEVLCEIGKNKAFVRSVFRATVLLEYAGI